MKPYALAALTLILGIATTGIIALAGDTKKENAKNWRSIVLEGKVYSDKQIEFMQTLSLARELNGAQLRQKSFWCVNALDPSKLSIDEVLKQYGKPEKKEEAKDASGRTYDAYRYGPIGVLTLKGKTEVVGLGAPGAFFLDGVKASARR